MKTTTPSGGLRIITALIDFMFYGILIFIFNLIVISIYGFEIMLMTFVAYFETDIPNNLFIDYLVLSSIINLFLGIIYYAVIPYYSKGQTIAKYLLKLTVVNVKGENPSLLKHALRSVILWNNYLTLPVLPFALWRFEVYRNLSSSFLSISAIFIAVSVIMMFNVKDPRGLHDLLLKTHVVLINPTEPKKDWLAEKDTEIV